MWARRVALLCSRSTDRASKFKGGMSNAIPLSAISAQPQPKERTFFKDFVAHSHAFGRSSHAFACQSTTSSGGYESFSNCEMRVPDPRKMMHGGGCSIKLSRYFFFTSAGASSGGSGGTSPRKEICPVACRFDRDGPS